MTFFQQRSRPIDYTQHRSFMLHQQRQPQQHVNADDDSQQQRHRPLTLPIMTREQLNAKVLATMRRIINSTANTKRGLPDYYIFTYRGYECWCLELRHRYVGFVRVPKAKPLRHPMSSSRPFQVGADIDVDNDDNSESLVGFHTWHLSDTTSFPGVPQHPRSVDYVVEQLQQYIDVCLLYEQQQQQQQQQQPPDKRKRKSTTTS
jgi:hypothetical protein